MLTVIKLGIDLLSYYQEPIAGFIINAYVLSVEHSVFCILPSKQFYMQDSKAVVNTVSSLY